MQVIEGGHRSGLTANHACCVGGTWYTEVTPEELEATLNCNVGRDTVTCEVASKSNPDCQRRASTCNPERNPNLILAPDSKPNSESKCRHETYSSNITLIRDLPFVRTLKMRATSYDSSSPPFDVPPLEGAKGLRSILEQFDSASFDTQLHRWGQMVP